jgi:TonB family protein
MHVLRLMPIAVVVLCATVGCNTTGETRAAASAPQSAPPVAPPLPERYKNGSSIEYYPDASRRAHESGEVVVEFTVGPKGLVDEPIAVNEQKSAAFPRLQNAARQIAQGIRFPVDDAYKRTLTASIVFEISDCGTVRHSGGADYDLNLCLNPPRDPNRSQAQGLVTPSCYGTLFGAQKADGAKAREFSATDTPPQAHSPMAPEGKAAKKRIRIQALPLESPPPEIARIKRGYISQFIGGFINDGLASWFGVDLDRMEVISVRRDIYDRRATLTKPFIDPSFQSWDDRSFVRKWSDKERTETEAVLLGVLDGPDADAFICIANKIWERDEPSADEMPNQTDTISSSSRLIDTTVASGKTFQSSVTVLPQGPLEAVIKAVGASLPQLEYKKVARKAKSPHH